MISVVISNVIIFILACISAVFSNYKFSEMLLGGILMILITAGYLTDGHEKLLKILQLFLAVLFAFLSGGWWGFIAFPCIIGLGMMQGCIGVSAAFIIYEVAVMGAGQFSGYAVASGILRLMII